jgi:elongation of very long chain fatty acids protein 7
MENRKPFKLRNLLIVYNFAQVLFSIFLFYEASVSGWFSGYSLRCQSVDYSNNPKALRVNITAIISLRLSSFITFSILFFDAQMAAGCWWYFFSKFTEFFDTFFFVMRKRYDQVSTLHVIHHGIMPFSGQYLKMSGTQFLVSLDFNLR